MSDVRKIQEHPQMKDILGRYWRSAKAIGTAHYKKAESLEKRNFWFRLLTYALSSVSGGVLFLAAELDWDELWRVLSGSMLLISVGVGTIQTLLKYPELSEKHRLSGAQYASLRREIDCLMIQCNSGCIDDDFRAIKKLGRILERFNDISISCPFLENKYYEPAKADTHREWSERCHIFGEQAESGGS
jgi:hypothetical protein